MSPEEPKPTREYLLGIVDRALETHKKEIAEGHSLPGDQKGDVTIVSEDGFV